MKEFLDGIERNLDVDQIKKSERLYRLGNGFQDEGLMKEILRKSEMNSNEKRLFRLVAKLDLQCYHNSFRKILKIIDKEEYGIIVNNNFREIGGIKTFWHYRSAHCSDSEKYIIINPDIRDNLDGKNLNFIWGLLHEVGHILTVGIRNGDEEMREVIAWDMAQHLLRCELTELEAELESFEKRVIYALEHYRTRRGNWNNAYNWVDEKNERLLKRVPNNRD